MSGCATMLSTSGFDWQKASLSSSPRMNRCTGPPPILTYTWLSRINCSSGVSSYFITAVSNFGMNLSGRWRMAMSPLIMYFMYLSTYMSAHSVGSLNSSLSERGLNSTCCSLEGLHFFESGISASYTRSSNSLTCSWGLIRYGALFFCFWNGLVPCLVSKS